MDSESKQVAAIGANDADLQPGEAVGDYVVARKIGEGGFGSVYRAEHPLIGKQVAIKVLNRQYSAVPEMVQRFVAEARAVNQIRHRNIIDIFGFGQLPDGRHYYVMEFLEGSALDEYIAERGRLDLAEAIPILRSVARALDAAHAKGIAHRDLKPENVFLCFEEGGAVHPKLLDFGIAKLLSQVEGSKQSFKTRTGAPMGTPYYMSPEQCRGRDVDHRTDIYAFGCVTYRALTGVFPFDGADYMEILIKQMNDEPQPASSLVAGLSPGIDDAVSWMLRKEPSARPPNLLSAIRALEEAAVAAGIAVPSETIASGVHAARTGPYGVTPTPTPAVVTPGRATTPTAAADTLAAAASMAAGARRGGARVLIAVLAVAVLGAGGFVAYKQVYARDDAAAPTAVPARPAVKPQPAPAPAPPKKQFADIEINGAPEGTEVFGPAGPVGIAPGKIQLPRGDQKILLTFRADGYKPTTSEVVPDQDGSLTVVLEALPPTPSAEPAPDKRRRREKRPRAGSSPTDSTNTLETIEDPFADPSRKK